MDLFMMCAAPNRAAASSLPEGFCFDTIREDELDVWMAFPFNTPELAAAYRGYMQKYFDDVYAPQRAEFFRRCLFVRDAAGKPVATGFVWKAYGRIWTLQWIKTLKGYEGLGIGRALLSKLLLDLPEEAYPVYLHTHPTALRAIKLYSDFGFALVTDPQVGCRTNHLAECRDTLREGLLSGVYENLRYVAASEALLTAAASREIEEF